MRATAVLDRRPHTRWAAPVDHEQDVPVFCIQVVKAAFLNRRSNLLGTVTPCHLPLRKP
jgi:hypothetical protein